MVEKQTKNNKLIEFLNTKLGLLILSGVFLTLIPFLYTNYKTSKESQQNQLILTTKLSTEIKYRLEVVKTLGNNNLRPYQIKDIRIVTYGKQDDLKSEYFNFKSIFNEYEKQSLISLIIQLDSQIPKGDKKHLNYKLIKPISKLKEYIDDLVLNKEFRKKISLPNDRYTYEYNYSENKKNELDKHLFNDINEWISAW